MATYSNLNNQANSQLDAQLGGHHGGMNAGAFSKPPPSPLLAHMDKTGSDLESRLSELAKQLENTHERIFGGPLNPPSDAQAAREPATAEESIRLRFIRAMDYLSRAESFAEQLNGRL